MYFDDLYVQHSGLAVTQENHYYPFGLNIQALERAGDPSHLWQFQGQEKLADFGLGWAGFKWRFADPQLGRFMSLDPIAEDYYYNSTYAFSENKVVAHVELEGLEAVSIQGEWRASAPVSVPIPIGGTTSMAVGVAIDIEGNVGVYSTTTFGVQVGAYIGAGLTGSLSTGNIDDLEGYGLTGGLAISLDAIGVGGEINFTIPTSFPDENEDSYPVPVGGWLEGKIEHIGFSVSPPLLGRGYGATVYGELSYTHFYAKGNILEGIDEIYKIFYQEYENTYERTPEDDGLTQEALLAYINSLIDSYSEDNSASSPDEN